MLEHLSYSSISLYLSCARSWRFKYIEGVPTYSTPELAFGSAIHGAIEGYLSQAERTKQPVDFWSASWSKATEGVQNIFWGADTPEHHCNEGVRILTHTDVLTGISAIQLNGLAVEEKVSLRVPGVPIPVIGYIDIQTADGVPGDIKTSSKSWSQERAESETQSLFYLASLNQANRTVPGWRFRHYVIVKTKTPQFQVYEHSHRPEEMFWLFSMIQNVYKGIEREVFPENPGSWRCSSRYCDFWSKCRGR